MPIQITMPALSPTMSEGTLAKWHVKEGDQVSSGDVIAEIETDKATMEVESIDDGRIGKILVAEGTEAVPVNQLIALLLEEGEDASALDGLEAGTPAHSITIKGFKSIYSKMLSLKTRGQSLYRDSIPVKGSNPCKGIQYSEAKGFRIWSNHCEGIQSLYRHSPIPLRRFKYNRFKLHYQSL